MAHFAVHVRPTTRYPQHWVLGQQAARVVEACTWCGTPQIRIQLASPIQKRTARGVFAHLSIALLALLDFIVRMQNAIRVHLARGQILKRTALPNQRAIACAEQGTIEAKMVIVFLVCQGSLCTRTALATPHAPSSVLVTQEFHSEFTVPKVQKIVYAMMATCNTQI